MNDSAVSIEMLKDILVDLDFESVYPSLTEAEFSLLEQNILSDGEVISPVIVVHVDDIGTVHCNFENGRRLSLVPGEDHFHKHVERTRDEAR